MMIRKMDYLYVFCKLTYACVCLHLHEQLISPLSLLMSSLSAVLLLGLVSLTPLTSAETVDLGGLPWTLSGQDSKGQEVRVPASVPGDVYSDLSEGGVLGGDLLYRFNDVEWRRATGPMRSSSL